MFGISQQASARLLARMDIVFRGRGWRLAEPSHLKAIAHAIRRHDLLEHLASDWAQVRDRSWTRGPRTLGSLCPSDHRAVVLRARLRSKRLRLLDKVGKRCSRLLRSAASEPQSVLKDAGVADAEKKVTVSTFRSEREPAYPQPQPNKRQSRGAGPLPNDTAATIPSAVIDVARPSP